MFRMTFITLSTAFALLFSTACFAQEKIDHAEYMKPAAVGEKKGEVVKGDISFDGARKSIQFIDTHGTTDFMISYSSISSMLYEQTAKPRYAEGILIAWPLLLTKSKKHYLTIHYSDQGGTSQFVIIHLDKTNYQQALAIAETETGKKVDRSIEN
jgi:hypothetical protein